MEHFVDQDVRGQGRIAGTQLPETGAHEDDAAAAHGRREHPVSVACFGMTAVGEQQGIEELHRGDAAVRKHGPEGATLEVPEVHEDPLVYGFGYAFSGDVSGPARAFGAPGSGSLHRLVWGKHETDLAEGENVLGRDKDAAVWIADSSASRRHALIRVAGSAAVLEDLGSKNGTSCNGKRVHRTATLQSGDEIRIGRVTFQFRTVSATASTSSRSSRSAV